MRKKNFGNSTLLLSDRIDIKPGTAAYNQKTYFKDMVEKLTVGKYNFDSQPVEIFMRFGISDMSVDLNVYTILYSELLLKKYEIDMRWVYRRIAEKELVIPGTEYFEFHITRLDHPLILRPNMNVS